jgi:hypothetical protein
MVLHFARKKQKCRPETDEDAELSKAHVVGHILFGIAGTASESECVSFPT